MFPAQSTESSVEQPYPRDLYAIGVIACSLKEGRQGHLPQQSSQEPTGLIASPGAPPLTQVSLPQLLHPQAPTA